MLYSHTLMHLINKNNNMNYLTLFLLSTLLLLTACGADDSSPASIVYDEGEDIEISADMIAKPRLALGYNHSCFILNNDNKEVMCWGSNLQGQLGYGNKTEAEVEDEINNIDKLLTEEETEELLKNLYSSRPIIVRDSNKTHITGAIEISASENHTCALLEGGNVKCWGSNSNWQLGNTELNTQHKQASSTAVDVNVADLQGVKAISVGNTYSCALLEAGDIKCWGKIPSGFSANNLLELTNKKPSQLATASAHACVVTEDNQVQCWGDSSKLGHSESEATEVTGIDKALLVSSKGNHSCALLNNGRVECWGDNLSGQIGNGLGDLNSVLTPNRVRNLSQVISLSSGEQYNCAATVAGQVLCWGNNQYGQLGYVPSKGATHVRPFSSIPTVVEGITTAKEVSVSQNHSCALLISEAKEESVSCWGKNDSGQLGNDKKLNFDDKRTPQSISSTPVKVIFD